MRCFFWFHIFYDGNSYRITTLFNEELLSSDISLPILVFSTKTGTVQKWLSQAQKTHIVMKVIAMIIKNLFVPYSCIVEEEELLSMNNVVTLSDPPIVVLLAESSVNYKTSSWIINQRLMRINVNVDFESFSWLDDSFGHPTRDRSSSSQRKQLSESNLFKRHVAIFNT